LENETANVELKKKRSDTQHIMWDMYQQQHKNLFKGSDVRSKFLLKRIHNNSKILNIGLGTGNFERLALSAQHETYSLDPSDASVQEFKDWVRTQFNKEGIQDLDVIKSVDDHFKTGVSQDIPFSNEMFDYVIMSEVLEHLTDEILDATLPEVKRVLKPHGRFLVTVPAQEVLEESNVVCPHCQKSFHRWGHEQSFTLEKIRSIVGKYFQIILLKEMIFYPKTAMQFLNVFTKQILYIKQRLETKFPSAHIFLEAKPL
jgi:SAM-dependent methyltransferase